VLSDAQKRQLVERMQSVRRNMDAADADDGIQEVAVELLRVPSRIEEYELRQVFAAVHRRLLNAKRVARRTVPVTNRVVSSRVASAEASQYRDTLVREVIACLRQLATPQQDQVLTAFLDGDSFTETAKMLGISPQAVSHSFKRLVERGAAVLNGSKDNCTPMGKPWHRSGGDLLHELSREEERKRERAK